MDAANITVDDFESICRSCMCDCKSGISFNAQECFVFKNIANNVLSKYVTRQVSAQFQLLYVITLPSEKRLQSSLRFVGRAIRQF